MFDYKIVYRVCLFILEILLGAILSSLQILREQKWSGVVLWALQKITRIQLLGTNGHLIIMEMLKIINSTLFIVVQIRSYSQDFIRLTLD